MAQPERRSCCQTGPCSACSEPTFSAKKVSEKFGVPFLKTCASSPSCECRHPSGTLQAHEGRHLPSVLTLMFVWLLMCCVVSLSSLILWSSSEALETAGYAVFAARRAGGNEGSEGGVLPQNGARHRTASDAPIFGENRPSRTGSSQCSNPSWPSQDVFDEAKADTGSQTGTQRAKDGRSAHFTPGHGLAAVTANLTCVAKKVFAVPFRVLGRLGDWAKRLSDCQGKCRKCTTPRQDSNERGQFDAHVPLGEVVVAAERARSELLFICRLALGAILSSGVGAVSLATVLFNGPSPGRQWLLCTFVQTLVVLIVASVAAWVFQPQFLTDGSWYDISRIRRSRRPV